MNTAAHPVAPEEVMALLDGELSSERTQFVSAHLEQCAECREAVTSLRDTLHSLLEWTVPVAPLNADFEEHLSASAAAESAKLRDSGSLGIGVFPRRRWRLAVASVCLAAILIIMIGMNAVRYEKPYSATQTVAEKQITLQEHGKRQIGVDALRPQTNARDSNGAFRGLGDHVQDSFSIDGQLNSEARAGKQQLKREQRESTTPYKGWIQSEPMIARTVSLSVVVKDFDASRASVDAILSHHNGYAAELSVATPEGAARTLQASLRIPAPELVKALAEMKALGRAEMEAQNGEEVTQQHADLVARLKNSRETEQRLQAILTERTGKISDVLSVEQEITRVRGEIEQMEAEQQTLEHRVEFATIDLKLAEEYKAQLSSPAPSVATQVRNASVNGFRNAFESALALVLFLAESGPAPLLWMVVLFLPVRMLWRRYRRGLALNSSLSA
jgi:Domain of unknown function (DUF4349)/Putative zinc-finger